MKCARCGEKAAVHMRQHKLALCQEHFLDWIPAQTQRYIEKYRMFGKDDRILVAVSGGKDSLSLWDILIRLGYQADGLFIGLGIHGGRVLPGGRVKPGDRVLPGGRKLPSGGIGPGEKAAQGDNALTGDKIRPDAGASAVGRDVPRDFHYSDESRRLAENFSAGRDLNLMVFDVRQEYGETIPEMARRTRRGKGKPCAVCGLVKRHIMNLTALKGKYPVLVTGHNLDDEAAILFGNTLNWVPGYLVRQWPVLEANRPGLVRKAKPLCRIYERDAAAYALLRGIDYIYEECPYAEGSKSIYYKELLNRLETDRPGAKLSFYLSFLEAKKNGLFAAHADPDVEKLHDCPTCGQSTSAPGECSFCRMRLKSPI